MKTAVLFVVAAVLASALFIEGRLQRTQFADLQRAIQKIRADNRRLIESAQTKGGRRAAGLRGASNAEALAKMMKNRKGKPESDSSLARPLQPGLKPVSVLTEEGQSSPVAAVDSALHAIYHGDVDRLAELIGLTPDGKTAAAALFASLPPGSQLQLRTPEYMMALLVAYGYNAVGYKMGAGHQDGSDPENWILPATVQLEDGRTVHPEPPLRLTNGQWQIEADANAVKQFGIYLTSAAALKDSK